MTKPGKEDHNLLRARTVLLVDESDNCRIPTKWFLTNFGFTVDTARSAEEALLLFNPKHHDIVVTGDSMPAMNGIEMAHIIKLRSPGTPVVMFGSAEPRDRACLDAVVLRPSQPLALRDAIESLIAARKVSSY